ncbi:MAG: 50S ribosomal protein L25 [Geobacteraceae bacterium]|nr:50S ribosomal protein L25 [Geobacteraceae bacterium]
MEQRVLTIESRVELGKGPCRRLRVNGRVPAVVYGKGFEPVTVSVDRKELNSVIAGEGGMNHLISLKGEAGLDGQLVIVAEMVRDCLKGEPIHVDLHKVNLEEKVRVKVPVNLVGTPMGVKEGGMLDFLMHSIDLECLASQIPEHIQVDISELAIGGSLHIADVKVPAGIKVLDDRKATVVNILGKAKEEEAAETVEEE